jgi:hypothetical protein
MPAPWLPEPDPGTAVCLGFDGSDVDDWTAIRGETREGLSFTPRFAGEPTIWNPAEHPDHRVPRAIVAEAVAELFGRFEVARMYCDPPGWQSEIETWALLHGEERVIRWETYRPTQMSQALDRFVADLRSGVITHDGCPITTTHTANAVKVGRKNDTYVLAKASKPQKIDAAMATVLAHEAAADMRAAGWVTEPAETYFRLPR